MSAENELVKKFNEWRPDAEMPSDPVKRIRAAVALLPEIKNHVEQLGYWVCEKEKASTVIEALEELSWDRVVDRNAVLEEVAEFLWQLGYPDRIAELVRSIKTEVPS